MHVWKHENKKETDLPLVDTISDCQLLYVHIWLRSIVNMKVLQLNSRANLLWQTHSMPFEHIGLWSPSAKRNLLYNLPAVLRQDCGAMIKGCIFIILERTPSSCLHAEVYLIEQYASRWQALFPYLERISVHMYEDFIWETYLAELICSIYLLFVYMYCLLYICARARGCSARFLLDQIILHPLKNKTFFITLPEFHAQKPSIPLIDSHKIEIIWKLTVVQQMWSNTYGPSIKAYPTYQALGTKWDGHPSLASKTGG